MEQGVFLNGRNQIIEMLKHMTPLERERLLNSISQKNPQLAEELKHQSFQFEDFNKLSDFEIKSFFHYITAPIIGIAIRGVSKTFQKRILSLADREYAESAFSYMTRPMTNEQRDIKRAQNKILEVIIPLLKKSRVTT